MYHTLQDNLGSEDDQQKSKYKQIEDPVHREIYRSDKDQPDGKKDKRHAMHSTYSPPDYPIVATGITIWY
ncbi:hypothetical protein N7528_009419 [Penicillium herquei]|nr:hypothetical protein N7528_009419 [Penicillium herquei]